MLRRQSLSLILLSLAMTPNAIALQLPALGNHPAVESIDRVSSSRHECIKRIASRGLREIGINGVVVADVSYPLSSRFFNWRMTAEDYLVTYTSVSPNPVTYQGWLRAHTETSNDNWICRGISVHFDVGKISYYWARGLTSFHDLSNDK